MTHKYNIEFAPAAARQFRKLPSDIQSRIAKAIDRLAWSPLPSGVKKLVGEEDLYRIRVGDYRVVYQALTKRPLILVVRVAHRREVYAR